MSPRTRVESFELDHTRVRAPYVRLAGQHEGPRGDLVVKWDLRLVQPNRAEIPTAPLHTIEHLLAGYLRDALEDVQAGASQPPVVLVDASPMGCRTGFYLTMLGELPADTMRQVANEALRHIARHQGEIPGCSPERCGNWRDHSLPGARAWAEQVTAEPLRVQETIPLP